MNMVISEIKRAITRPRRVPSHIYSEIRRFNGRRKTHPAVINMISEVTGENTHTLSKYYEEISNDDNMINRLSHFGNIIGHYAIPNHCLLLYLSCRIVKPDIVVETGVHKGSSSAVILQALEKNDRGKLFSIDLPGTEGDPVIDPTSPYDTVKYKIPDGSAVGTDVPERLYHRWNLHLGRSNEVLEPLVDDIDPVDVFMHDSDHSYKNMMYEFKTIQDYLSGGGLILSDDVDWNNSFEEFSSSYSEDWSQLSDIVCEKIIKERSMVGIAKMK